MQIDAEPHRSEQLLEDGGFVRHYYLWEHWAGGVQLFAGTDQRGANRLACVGAAGEIEAYRPYTPEINWTYSLTDWGGGNFYDDNLGRRPRDSDHVLDDIWNRFGPAPKNLGAASFRAIARPGCKIQVTMEGPSFSEKRWELNNRTGTKNISRKWNMPRTASGLIRVHYVWKQVWVGDGYILKKVRTEEWGPVSFRNKVSYVVMRASCKKPSIEGLDLNPPTFAD